MPEYRVVHGHIEFPPDAPPCTPAQVVVEVEDISRADAPSQVVARQRLRPGPLRGGDRLPFSLQVPAETLDERHLYSVRVHVDLSGSGEVKHGDYITMQTFPVLTRGHGKEARVAVRRVV